MNLLTYIIVIVFLASCNNNSSKVSSADNIMCESGIYTYNLEEELSHSDTENRSINNIAKEIKFINLSSKNDVILSEINLNVLPVYDNGDKYLIVSSFRTPVYKFDSLGLNGEKIIDLGRTKGEINKNLYNVSYSNDCIIVSLGRKIIKYSLKDKSLEGIVSNKYYYNSIMMNDGNYVALPYIGHDASGEDFLDSQYEYAESLLTENKSIKIYVDKENKYYYE
ncbi:MAG: hypothetical protein R3Y26_02150 [Rikenellaceae bacterium]